MNLERCWWSQGDDLYEAYHDEQWGVAVYDDRLLFEYLLLETFQAGLSWITILRKRENFRAAFDDFNYQKVAAYNEDKLVELSENAGIIRNKLKIKAAVSNAQAFMKIQEEFGSFSAYYWQWTDGNPIVNHFSSKEEVPATTDLSDALSKDLKKRGFKFVGSTIIYAHMQATGMVNDHLTNCPCHPVNQN
jgi:DNA-3-methyladenine glycosylase I